MGIRSWKLERRWAVSLGLSLAILAAGAAWVVTFAGPPPAELLTSSTAYGIQPEDLGRVVDTADLIVEGVITEVYPAEWTTPDKNPPVDPARLLTDRSIQLRTPVLLEVSDVHKGDSVPGTVLFTAPGGATDELIVSSPLGIVFQPGQKIVAFLSKAPADAGPWAEISPLYPQLVLITEGGKAVGPERVLTRAELLSQISQGGK